MFFNVYSNINGHLEIQIQEEFYEDSELIIFGTFHKYALLSIELMNYSKYYLQQNTK